MGKVIPFKKPSGTRKEKEYKFSFKCRVGWHNWEYLELFASSPGYRNNLQLRVCVSCGKNNYKSRLK